MHHNFRAVFVNTPELYRYRATSPSRNMSMIEIKVKIIFATPLVLAGVPGRLHEQTRTSGMQPFRKNCGIGAVGLGNRSR